MTLKARITRYTKNSTDSPGWKNAATFIDYRDGVAPLPPTLTDMTALEAFVASWRAVQVKMLLAPVYLQLGTVDDEMTHYAIMACQSYEDLITLMRYMRDGDNTFGAYIENRNGLAAALDVNITTFGQVDLDVESLDQLTPEKLRILSMAAVPSPD